jgi:hypothetical protein
MKNMRIIFYISAAFALLTAVISCSDPLSAPDGKESGIIIRIAGSDGRTILPSAPVFSNYELFLQKEGEEEPTPVNTEGIESSGVYLKLSAGNWTITLEAYQDILGDLILAAKGSAEITVNKEDGLKTVSITLMPIPINEDSINPAPGLFSFNIILPQGVEEAVLELKNEDGYNKEINLIDENSGSFKLSRGYYEMSIILKKSGQNAGLFESVHIYSGLVSKADIDLSDIVFVDKVYVAGALGGIRLGKIQFFDENKTFIRELNLDNKNKAERTADWITDIPSSNIGKAVYITQVFNGEEATVEIIPQANGKDGIALTLIPNAQSQNIAPWYSTARSSGGENPQLAVDGDLGTCWNIPSGTASLELDYGFDVTVNDAQVIFSDGSPAEGGYSVEYWDGAAWIQAAGRGLTGAEEYDCFFKTVTAKKFRLNINASGGAIAEFSLSLVTGRVPEVLEAASSYHEVTLVWKEEAQKADEYKIYYKYDGEAWQDAGTVAAGNCERDASNNFMYTFKPNGYNNATRAGLELQFMVEAVKTTGDSIASENDVRAKLIGPALLSPSASTASSPNAITVSWNKIEGAGGYYVFRRQFDMKNEALEGTTIAYYVSGSGTITVTGKGLKSGADTTTVKATASVSGTRFTLTDSWMTDAEYKGDYSAYGTYRDQQNDMAQGKPYHYFIVPVLANEQLASVSYTGGTDYTIQGVTVTNAASLEKTGFTVGFGQNVTATKGTYASSGNVNNGIQITWSAPPLLASAGVTPQYTLYRKSVNGLETVSSTLGNATSHVDTTAARGVDYDYFVGISTSQPSQSERFEALCKTQTDANSIPKMRGYMLDYVKVASVTRGEDATLNAKYGERVTWETGAVRVDGYTIYVMNRNISAEWYWIADNINATQPLNSTQNFEVTPNITATAGTGIANVTGNSRSITLNTTAGNMAFDLLRVMRDYKHFFKVRSYVNGPNGKVYCPDPAWTYTYKFGTTEAAHIAASNDMQNDYVKWGARQITKDEFIKIASVYASRGINESWAGASDKTYNAGTTWGGSGSVTQDYTYQGATDAHRNYKYSNFKVDLQTRAHGTEWVTFITINGNIWSRMYPIGSWAFRYGEDGWVTIKGPWDTPNLYTGQIIFGVNKNLSGGNNGGFSWNGNGTTSGGTSTSESGSTSARVAVKYPGTAAAEEQFLYRGRDTALQFKGESDNRYQLEEYK